ncbi:amino acid ABC transporter permease [Subtercola frigoramans]|uniref:Polar amino acid transport system permease protein n=1 Tax=Subtercola frigoramans TaxID=120298 RepID=A0ABS2L7E0_9MICO|nr:amino acid ABC transporter permease [Subtercola frigoramans]MBM7473025.1 polar amino acid transport system permease protein [Subtercola frigoramans]
MTEQAAPRRGPGPRLLADGRRAAVGQSLMVVPVRHYGRMILAVVVVLAVIGAAYSLATNPNFDWSIVAKFVFSPSILRGLGSTLLITIVAEVIAIVLSIIIAIMRVSKSRIVSSVAAAYVFFFRGIPIIVLLIIVGNLGLFIKVVTIGIPFTDIVFFSAPISQIVTPFVASVLGLSLAGAAYMAEIMRSGLLAVGKGQREAAKALGLNGARTLRYIVLPQALRVILPPMGNEFIGMLKASAIVSVIAGGDLLTVALGIAGTNYRTIELLIVATIWYLLVIAVFSVGQFFLERRTAEK